jgi:peptidoglycan-associated lipoprotein
MHELDSGAIRGTHVGMKQRILLIAGAALLVAAGCSKNKKPTTETATNEAPAATSDEEAPPVEEAVTTAPDPLDLQHKIYFEFDSSALDDGARRSLDNNAEWLKENPARHITIEGHTDEVGTTEYNVALGDRRARSAKDYLVALGIEESRVKIISYGKERPEMPGVDEKNRRSVFIVTK